MVLRRSAGIWGPAAFAAAAWVAARRVPGYSHRTNHISGLAASGSASAPVMVPGFVALGVASLVQSSPDPSAERLMRVAGVATIGAGLAQCSSVECPMPGVDEEATTSDVLHSATSITGFAAWTALPFVTAIRPGPSWYRRLSALLAPAMLIGLVANGLLTRRRSDSRGLGQRLFLASVFTWYASTSLAELGRSTP